MTFCKTLKTETINGKTVTAFMETPKFSAAADYKIAISENGIAYDVIKTARTTWAKKYAETVESLKR